MVIIGIREEAKIITRNRIVEKTKELLFINGFVKVSSKDIANLAEVSQGSIFLHFGTKNNLLNEILESNIVSLTNELKNECDTSSTSNEFLRNLIEVVSKHENLLSRSLKDYPYLDEYLCKQIDNFDTLLKNIIFDNMRKNSEMRLNIVDSFIYIDGFVSQLKFYLIQKDENQISISIINQRRGRISKLYKKLIL